MNFFQRHADKLGTGGSLFAALCCLGTPAVVALLASIGAGFLIDDLILLPLLAASLFAALWGLEKGREVHRDSRPLWTGAAGAMLLAGGIFVGPWAVGHGAALLIGGSIWNVVARRRCMAKRTVPAATVGEKNPHALEEKA